MGLRILEIGINVKRIILQQFGPANGGIQFLVFNVLLVCTCSDAEGPTSPPTWVGGSLSFS